MDPSGFVIDISQVHNIRSATKFAYPNPRSFYAGSVGTTANLILFQLIRILCIIVIFLYAHKYSIVYRLNQIIECWILLKGDVIKNTNLTQTQDILFI